MQARHLCLLLLLLFCNTAASAAQADTVRRAEAFIDTDPGVGSGTPLTVSSPKDTVTLTASITLPAGLSTGVHYLYTRTYASDSGDINGRWSLPIARRFFVSEKVVASEYFWDADPGLGNGNALPVGTAADSVAFTPTISTTGLTGGFHYLYVRTRSATGPWSLTAAKRFFVNMPGSIAGGEYFFDNDPGIGSGTPFSLTPSDSVNGTFTASTTGLSIGQHMLYARTKDGEGHWSLAPGRKLFITTTLASAEYFFDNDPGVGNGTALTVPLSDSVNQSYTIPTTGLSAGLHLMYVRAKNADGKWGLTGLSKQFLVLPKVVASEYFWDTDPGVGNGIALAVASQTDTITQSYSLVAPCLTPGRHYVYVRSKDEYGNWSLTGTDSIVYANPLMDVQAMYPGPGPYGTPLKAIGSGGHSPYMYTVLNGTPGTDSIFLQPNNMSITLVAIDSCGYKDTTTITTPAAPTMIAGSPGITTGTGIVSLDGYRYWTYVQDGSGNLIGAIKDNGQNLGTVTMSYLKHDSTDVRITPHAGGIPFLDRNWNVTTSIPPVAAVAVQLFAVDSEFNKLDAADAGISSKSDLRINKYDGQNEDLDIYDNTRPGNYAVITPDSVVTFTGQTTSGDGYALAFRVSGFSEFYETRNDAISLPIQDVQLSAQKDGSAVRLVWKTTGEKGTILHRLMRGERDGAFSQIAALKPGATEANIYTFRDEHPLSGVNYYRVAVDDAGGRRFYSQTVVVRMDGGHGIITIAPNPAHDMVTVGGLQSGDGVSLRNMAGQIVWQGAAASDEMRIALSDFSSGIYMMTIDAAGGARVVQRLEIAH